MPEPARDAAEFVSQVFTQAQHRLRRSRAQLQRSSDGSDDNFQVITRAGISVSRFLERNLDALIEVDQEYRRRFLAGRTGLHLPALDLAWLANLVACEVSRMTLEDWRPAGELPPRLNALSELQAHAIVVTSEIITLLREGYPAGARARWRTLHELAVTARLLSRRGRGLSQRYLDSLPVEMRAALRAGELLGPRSGRTAAERSVADEIEREATAALQVHGDELARPNGWAFPVVGRKQITFRDLERSAGATRRRSAYKSASTQLHSGRRGSLAALLLRGYGGFYVGRRGDGFLEPARQTLWAANELSGLLLAEVHKLTEHDEALIWDECHSQLTLEADIEIRRAATSCAILHGDYDEALRLTAQPRLGFLAFVRDIAGPASPPAEAD